MEERERKCRVEVEKRERWILGRRMSGDKGGGREEEKGKRREKGVETVN